MKSDEIRSKFIKFFEGYNHKLVKSASLKTDDPSVLLTVAGMQQFKDYYVGLKNAEKDFKSKDVITIQPCFRTSDIDEVGDEYHLTFFEMLGNFSFGGYFKDNAIRMAYELVRNEFGIDKDRIFVSIFEGANGILRDEESEEVWKKLGLKSIKGGGGFWGPGFGMNLIKPGSLKDNFWGPTGDTGVCGPSTEIYVDGMELWNIVFNEYHKDVNGKLHLLSQKGVDTGMGFERLVRIVQGKKTVFETDLFKPLMDKIRELKVSDSENIKAERVIADHVRGVVFLIKDGVRPSNIAEGYILRRVLRRAIRYCRLLLLKDNFLEELINVVINQYSKYYSFNKKEILNVVNEEYEKFKLSLDKGLKEFNKRIFTGKISGEEAFLLYQSYGFPIEITKDLAREKELEVDEDGFYKEFEKHQEMSRKGAGMFKSGLKNHDEKTVRLHTASHLLLAALNIVLGGVEQKGSNITPERLRFDFNFDRRLTKEELEEVERIVNKKINEGLEVKVEEMRYKEAVKRGFKGVFEGKYPETVSCYSIGGFSKEICSGPHVSNTKELGHFKIIKEESSSGGVRRIKAVLVDLDDLKLSKKTLRNIEKAKAEIEAGKFHTLSQLEKELGL